MWSQGAAMHAKSASIFFCLAVLGAATIVPASGQIMGGGMQPPVDPGRRPTEVGDPSATHGDRHDVDDNPFLKQPPRMSPSVSDLMKATLAAAGQKDWTTAKTKLQEARAVSNPTAFDSFEIEVVAGFVSVNTADHATALASYKKVIDSPFFATAQTKPQQSAILRNAMVLANEGGDYTSAIGFGAKLAAAGPLDDQSAIALAVAYYGNKDYATAKSLAQKAIDAAVAAGTKPSEIAAEIVTKSSASLH
jgi:hypothetical protein